MYQLNEINFDYLKNKKVLVLSDTSYPYDYVVNFLKNLKDSQVYIYICPATTSRFVKLWMKLFLNKKVNIIKDKHYKLFFKDKIDEYEIVLIFGKVKNTEQIMLRSLLRNMLISYKDITIVSNKGIDCDENYTIRRWK